MAYMKEGIAKYKEENPGVPHKEAFSKVRSACPQPFSPFLPGRFWAPERCIHDTRRVAPELTLCDASNCPGPVIVFGGSA